MEQILVGLAILMVLIAVISFNLSQRYAAIDLDNPDNPISLFWLASIIFSSVSLAMFCAALGINDGTIYWLIINAAVIIMSYSLKALPIPFNQQKTI